MFITQPTLFFLFLSRWLTPLLLLLDTHEKMAVTTKRKQLHDKVEILVLLNPLTPGGD